MKKVVMVTLSTCPWCKKAMKYFERRGVPFENTYYDQQDPEEQSRLERMILDRGDSLTFPWVRVGAESVSGWNPERYAQLLGLDPDQ
jgi:glutaredoxin